MGWLIRQPLIRVIVLPVVLFLPAETIPRSIALTQNLNIGLRLMLEQEIPVVLNEVRTVCIEINRMPAIGFTTGIPASINC